MTTQLIDDPAHLEPLLPREGVSDGVLGKAHDLQIEALRLAGMCQSGVSSELTTLLRSMNSYYSNKIEGEHTRPLDITRALASDFSGDADKARLQRLAVAHINTEEWIRDTTTPVADLYSMQALVEIHGHLFGQLEASDRIVRMHDRDGNITEEIETLPGEIRKRPVAVKRHVAPDASSLEAMVGRWASVYSGVRRGEMQIIAAAAAHHRLTWIHPFLDGNGRTARLHTLAVLQSLGLTQGLWSPLRGLARSGDRYSEKLANADIDRMGDLDGRGQLSERMLLEWIDFFLEVCIDQVKFMSAMLNLQSMQDRIAAMLSHEAHVVKRGLRLEALRPLHYLFATQGELTRGDFASMTGLGDRTATTLIGNLITAGLLRTDSPKGAVRFGIPMDSLRFLFPNLWPEAEADAAGGV